MFEYPVQKSIGALNEAAGPLKKKHVRPEDTDIYESECQEGVIKLKKQNAKKLKLGIYFFTDDESGAMQKTMGVYCGERNRAALTQKMGMVVQKSGIRLPPLGIDIRVRDRYHASTGEQNEIDLDMLDEGYDDPNHENYNASLAKKVTAQFNRAEQDDSGSGHYAKWGFGASKRHSLTQNDLDSEDEGNHGEQFARIAGIMDQVVRDKNA